MFTKKLEKRMWELAVAVSEDFHKLDNKHEALVNATTKTVGLIGDDMDKLEQRIAKLEGVKTQGVKTQSVKTVLKTKTTKKHANNNK